MLMSAEVLQCGLSMSESGFLASAAAAQQGAATSECLVIRRIMSGLGNPEPFRFRMLGESRSQGRLWCMRGLLEGCEEQLVCFSLSPRMFLGHGVFSYAF